MNLLNNYVELFHNLKSIQWIYMMSREVFSMSKSSSMAFVLIPLLVDIIYFWSVTESFLLFLVISLLKIVIIVKNEV